MNGSTSCSLQFTIIVFNVHNKFKHLSGNKLTNRFIFYIVFHIENVNSICPFFLKIDNFMISSQNARSFLLICKPHKNVSFFVDNVYNFVYNFLFSIFSCFVMWITFHFISFHFLFFPLRFVHFAYFYFIFLYHTPLLFLIFFSHFSSF